MRGKFYRHGNIVLILGLFLSLWSVSAQASPPISPPSPGLHSTVGTAVRSDVSPALRDMRPISTNVPVREIPETNLRLPRTEMSLVERVDPVWQSGHSPLTMPSPLTSFDGVGNVNGVHPPDTQGDIGYDAATGTKYYVQWVNLSFAIWDVTSTPTQIYGPVNGNTLWQGFGGVCETTNHGDPITLFDTMANRWMMSQFSVNGPYYQCIAVSQTADPTGAWHRYAFQVSATKMNDYPHFGVWPDGYYMTVNQFTGGASWGGAGVFVFDRTKMLTGDPTATFQYFDLYNVNPNFGGMLPSDLDGATLPPSGAPNYFFQADSNDIKLWEFDVDWTTPANTTFGISGQPNATIPIAAWTEMCPYTRDCIPQQGSSEGLDVIGDRLMYRVAYRNFGTHESLVLNHTVNAGGNLAGVRWYEIRDPNGSPTLYQQGTFAPDSDHRWMASIAMDAVGNMGLGYSVSSNSMYPSIRYTGRLANDPLGQMTQGEATLVNGTGAQTSSYNRWGDYSMMGIDPVDDCTFWFTTEYLASTGYAPWSTRIGSFRFPNCGASQPDPGMLRGLVSDNSTAAPLAGVALEAESDVGSVESTVTGADGSYALVLSSGDYDITASKYGYETYQQAGVTVVDGVTTTLDIQLPLTPRYQVSGYVTDARTGWPLYAHIQVTGDPHTPPAPHNATWTDPVTGYYSFTLVADIDYILAVAAWPSGYHNRSVAVNNLSSYTALDIVLQPDMIACKAPGYAQLRNAAYEFDFTGGLPVAWSVLDNAGTHAVWRFDDPKSRGNRTGGAGDFAIIDSDHTGPKAVNTELRTGSLDLSAQSNVILEFDYDFRWYSFGGDEQAAVDVSANGGTTWSTVWQRSGASDRGPQTARVDISNLAAGQSDVRLRFHYWDAEYDWWWQVDNVFLGSVDCTLTPGGLVVGEVSDANTQGAIAAQVSSAVDATTATPLAGAGGFYTLFAPVGSQTITATATGYGLEAVYLTVVQSDTVRQNIILDAGVVSNTIAFSATVTVMADMTDMQYFTLTNSGYYPVDFDIETINAPMPVTAPIGPFAVPVRRVSPKHSHDLDARGVRSFVAPETSAWPGGEVLQSWNSGLASPWGVVALPATTTRPEGTVWVNDTRFGGGDDRHYAFSAAGVAVHSVSSFTNIDLFAADLAYDPVANTLWQVNVGGDTCIYELDAETLSLTGQTVCVDFGVSERGLAYDPVSETFFAGSWNDQAIVHFDKSGQTLDSWDTALNVGGLAYNPVSGLIFAMSNASSGYDVYVLDTRAGYTLLGGFDIVGLGEFAQAGLAMDVDGHLWTVNQSTGVVLQVTSGEGPMAPWAVVPWLSADPISGTLPVGGTQVVAVVWDAVDMVAGEYPAHLRINNSTPYGVQYVPATLNVMFLHNVAADTASGTVYGDPLVTVAHTVRVTNTGMTDDAYDIVLSGAGWEATATDATATLASGAGADVMVNVTVPENALCGASDSLTVTLTSQGNANRIAAVGLTTIANAEYAVDAELPVAALAGLPGETVTATISVLNTGNCTGDFEVSAVGRWPVSMPSPVVQVAPDGTAPVVAEVRIPASALAGDSDMATVMVSSLDDVAQYTPLSLRTTAAAVYAAALSPASVTRDVFIGDSTRYAFTLTNLGNAADTFTLTTTGDNFPTVISPMTMTLDVGASAPLSVTVTVPVIAMPGVADSLALRATGTVTVAQSVVTTTAVLSYGVALTADPMLGQALAGMPVTYSVWITNTGGAKDMFDVALDGSAWLTTVLAEVGPLASGAGVEVVLVVVVPATATVGMQDEVAVMATSQAAPTHTAGLTLTTSVVDCLPVSGASFTYAPAPAPGATVTFTGAVASGTAPITYTWAFGRDVVATGPGVTHTFPSSTGLIPYTVVMTATNDCGFDVVQEVLVLEMYMVFLPLVMRQ